MSKIRILTPEELEARDQQLSAEERARLYGGESHSEPQNPPATRRAKSGASKARQKSSQSFENLYPNIAHFVKEIGWIEFGRNDDIPLTSFIRAIDMGGMVWEGQDTYNSLDEAFHDLEQNLEEWMEE